MQCYHSNRERCEKRFKRIYWSILLFWLKHIDFHHILLLCSVFLLSLCFAYWLFVVCVFPLLINEVQSVYRTLKRQKSIRNNAICFSWKRSWIRTWTKKLFYLNKNEMIFFFDFFLNIHRFDFIILIGTRKKGNKSHRLA